MLTIVLGFVLGFLIGLTGVGGGALVAPAFYVILGLPYQESVALSLVYSFFTKIFSALQHIRQGTVVWNVTLLYGLAGVPGAILGSHLMYAVDETSERSLPFFMAAVLFVVAALILLETTLAGPTRHDKPFSPTTNSMKVIVSVAIIQVFVGLLLGITSVGAGSLVIVSMLYLFRMTVKEIVGSNIIIALIMLVPAGLTHYMAGGLNWSLLALTLTGSLVGGVLGAKTTLIASDRLLKYVIATLVAAGGLSTVIKAW